MSQDKDPITQRQVMTALRVPGPMRIVTWPTTWRVPCRKSDELPGVACTKVSACIGVGLSDRNGAREAAIENPRS